MTDGVRQHAVDQLAKSFDGVQLDEGDFFTGFDCTQADLLALVLVLHGHPKTAAYVLVRHSEDDDSGDAHGEMREHCDRESRYGVPPGDGKAIEIARRYVADMVASVTDELSDRCPPQEAHRSVAATRPGQGITAPTTSCDDRRSGRGFGTGTRESRRVGL